MNTLLNALRATAEPTRLRLLALCSEAELTVTELTSDSRAESAPRIPASQSVVRSWVAGPIPEGTWAFYRLADAEGPGGLARDAHGAHTQAGRGACPGSRTARMRSRNRGPTRRRPTSGRMQLDGTKFAPSTCRSPMSRQLFARSFADRQIGDFLDIGTGTGRMLELFADRFRRGIGIDLSHDMLAVARTNLERAGHSHCRVRHGDMYHLPLSAAAWTR